MFSLLNESLFRHKIDKNSNYSHFTIILLYDNDYVTRGVSWMEVLIETEHEVIEYDGVIVLTVPYVPCYRLLNCTE